ncbi:hypothetical protein MASR1M32_37540 [Rhodobacter sp.]
MGNPAVVAVPGACVLSFRMVPWPKGSGRMQKAMVFLVLAIVLEVIATTALARSQSFSRLWPSVIAVLGYAGAFWLLSYPCAACRRGSSTRCGRGWGSS